jgi:hypothetical protein
MWGKVIEAEGTCRNAFDGLLSTRWNDGFPDRNAFSSIPFPYRSPTSLWRLDLGNAVDLAKLELHIVRRTDSAFLEAAEVSADLKTWMRVSGLSLKETERIPFLKEIRQRKKSIKLFDVVAGKGDPTIVSIVFPANRSRFLRIRGRDFSVSEINGFDRDGRALDRSKWRATNFYGDTPAPARVLKSVHTLKEFWPGQEFAVAVRGGKQKLDQVESAFVLFTVDGKLVVPQHRVPSYPFHAYEANSAWLIDQKLEGMTFRLPTREEWQGRKVDVYVLLFGDGAGDVKATVRLVTPAKPVMPKILSVRPAAK